LNDNPTFTQQLLHWFDKEKRALPWRKTKDPYFIWLSEIILQQTRVEQGLPYWMRFVEEFPTIHDLACADEKDVLLLWQGLGYYSRARNLHHTAKYIDQELNGSFPNTYSEILKLKGVGPYTAAAIASIAFNESKPVVDGNVFRFTSRFFGISEDISKSSTRKTFENFLSGYISHQAPGTFNQAMMEYGATVCTPKPKCQHCLFRLECHAFITKTMDELPVKSKNLKIRDRHFNYIVFHSENHWLLSRRDQKDVWQGLYDYYLIEGRFDESKILKEIEYLGINGHQIEISVLYRHLLSHQKLHCRFFRVDVEWNVLNDLSKKLSMNLYSDEEVLTLPKPKLIVNYLDEIQKNL
jgi:A/G-specific adenine glycosylase